MVPRFPGMQFFKFGDGIPNIPAFHRRIDLVKAQPGALSNFRIRMIRRNPEGMESRSTLSNQKFLGLLPFREHFRGKPGNRFMDGVDISLPYDSRGKQMIQPGDPVWFVRWERHIGE